MNEESLTPQQILNWRHLMFDMLEARSPGAGLFAIIAPESAVIEFWKKIKSILESPPSPVTRSISRPIRARKSLPKPCDHSNSITGQHGRYCIDCEIYI